MLDHHSVVIAYYLSKVGDRKLIPQITNTQNCGLTQSVRLADVPQMRQIADYSLQTIIFCNLRIFPIFCRLIQLPQILYYIFFSSQILLTLQASLLTTKNFKFVNKIFSVNFAASQIFYWRTAISGKLADLLFSDNLKNAALG